MFHVERRSLARTALECDVAPPLSHIHRHRANITGKGSSSDPSTNALRFLARFSAFCAFGRTPPGRGTDARVTAQIHPPRLFHVEQPRAIKLPFCFTWNTLRPDSSRYPQISLPTCANVRPPTFARSSYLRASTAAASLAPVSAPAIPIPRSFSLPPNHVPPSTK
jgi:hypothetical protein